MALKQIKSTFIEEVELFKEPLMHNLTISFPIILYIFLLLKENENKVDSYLGGPCIYLKILSPMALLMSFIVIHISGIEHLSHYQEHYQHILYGINSTFPVYGSGKIRAILSLLPGSMINWKILLLQRHLVMKHTPELLLDEPSKFLDKFGCKGTLDVDGISFVSYSDDREGSKLGHHRRRKGKPTLQGSASFIGKIFIDFKLFAGNINVCTHFKKAVKRARSMGYKFSVVRADTIYGNLKNLLFLEKLSLNYIMGINVSLIAIQDGIKRFKKLAREKSAKIIHIGKGSAILDLGKINVAPKSEKPVYRHVVLCRRIHRRRNKNGKMKIKEYFYAIVTDLPLTTRQIFKFYHQRQKIENGLKEVQYHYAFNKLVSQGKKSLKENELWMISKIFAMTMAKIFSHNMLPKHLHNMRLRTILRRLFANTIFHLQGGKVHLLPKPKHLWHLKRIFVRLRQNRFLSNPFEIVALARTR